MPNKKGDDEWNLDDAVGKQLTSDDIIKIPPGTRYYDIEGLFGEGTIDGGMGIIVFYRKRNSQAQYGFLFDDMIGSGNPLLLLIFKVNFETGEDFNESVVLWPSKYKGQSFIPLVKKLTNKNRRDPNEVVSPD